jgi:hypothetical protein
MLYDNAVTGTRQINGNSVTSACAAIFASTVTVIGAGLNSSCSRLPSSASLRNKPSSASSDDNSAATHSTPVPSSRSCCVVGDNASGNSATTMTKKISGYASSLQRRKATRTSRTNTALNAFI